RGGPAATLRWRRSATSIRVVPTRSGTLSASASRRSRAAPPGGDRPASPKTAFLHPGAPPATRRPLPYPSSIVSRRTVSLLATAAVGAALSMPAAASAADYPSWAPDVPWGAGCDPAPSPAQRTASNCGATLVDGEAVPPAGAPPIV